MVEYTLNLNSVFNCLSDSTRRDILKRVANQALSIGEIAKSYKLTFAAISKHLKVLEKAKLITKNRHGKEQIVQLSPIPLKSAVQYLEFYRNMWDERLNSLEEYLNNQK